MAEAIEPTLAALLGDRPAHRGALSGEATPSASASRCHRRLENARMLATRSPLPVSSVIAREKFGPSSPMQVCPAASP